MELGSFFVFDLFILTFTLSLYHGGQGFASVAGISTKDLLHANWVASRNWAGVVWIWMVPQGSFVQFSLARQFPSGLAGLAKHFGLGAGVLRVYVRDWCCVVLELCLVVPTDRLTCDAKI
jgi:hypothetical protein